VLEAQRARGSSPLGGGGTGQLGAGGAGAEGSLWSASSLHSKADPPPWCGLDGRALAPKHEILPVRGWEWDGEWQLVTHKIEEDFGDKDGWVYGERFRHYSNNGKWSLQGGSGGAAGPQVRRRCWQRGMVPFNDSAHSSSSGGGSGGRAASGGADVGSSGDDSGAAPRSEARELLVRVHRCEGLPPGTDARVRVRLGSQTEKTAVVKGCAAPAWCQWNTLFAFPLAHSFVQMRREGATTLTLEVWAEHVVRQKELLGCVKLDLATMLSDASMGWRPSIYRTVEAAEAAEAAAATGSNRNAVAIARLSRAASSSPGGSMPEPESASPDTEDGVQAESGEIGDSVRGGLDLEQALPQIFLNESTYLLRGGVLGDAEPGELKKLIEADDEGVAAWDGRPSLQVGLALGQTTTDRPVAEARRLEGSKALHEVCTALWCGGTSASQQQRGRRGRSKGQRLYHAAVQWSNLGYGVPAAARPHWFERRGRAEAAEENALLRWLHHLISEPAELGRRAAAQLDDGAFAAALASLVAAVKLAPEDVQLDAQHRQLTDFLALNEEVSGPALESDPSTGEQRGTHREVRNLRSSLR
jgi:hypothetical protein